jgi:glycosyltransferase involved in cell wall biosynthesis
VERLLERSSVVVAPSEREGFGLAAAEAMAFGRPVVAAAGGALLELVADGETGLLVPPRDAAALRTAVERLLADPELCERLGRAARARARQRFGWDGVTDRTLDVYRDALASAR